MEQIVVCSFDDEVIANELHAFTFNRPVSILHFEQFFSY